MTFRVPKQGVVESYITSVQLCQRCTTVTISWFYFKFNPIYIQYSFTKEHDIEKYLFGNFETDQGI